MLVDWKTTGSILAATDITFTYASTRRGP
eukprot:CCRYP_007897-RA/>CCRYP_007897-RA protein AED:0.32 eAED:0.32 QI:38/1/1/1/0/0/2/82/28